MSRAWFPKRYADLAARSRVPAGFAVAIACLWLAQPTWNSLLTGLPFMLGGLVLRAWAAGHLAKNQRLVTSGPYAWVRNPLYAGTALVAAGLAIASRRWLAAALLSAFLVLVYLPVVEQEEQHLRKLFPEYEEYARSTPRFLPRRSRLSGREHFSWELYWRNREYQAALGWLAGLLVLLAKIRA